MMQSHPDIAWGKRTRVILDVGCGVASFGGYLFERDVLAMSFAPKDEHEAQVQFALERGIPAMLAVMGTKRLPFPSSVFDVVHCARCRVPWHVEGDVCVYSTQVKISVFLFFLFQRYILSPCRW
jgi:SAM-dependent methyltransferase